MTAIWRRELQSYFHTPIGWIYTGVFLTLSSILFYAQILAQRSSDLLSLLGTLSYLWMLLSPILTMRLIAEEKQKKTDQLLLTSPASICGIVVGKYLAAAAVMVLTAALTLLYVLVVAIYGQVWAGELLVGYLGFLLEGSAFLAVDLYASSLTRTPAAAAVIAFGFNFLFWILDLVQVRLTGGILSDALGFLSIYGRNEPFFMGQLSYAAIFYDISLICCFLFFAAHRMEAQRMAGGLQ